MTISGERTGHGRRAFTDAEISAMIGAGGIVDAPSPAALSRYRWRAADTVV
ncbi:hypothetical protein [Paractinoplanes durhamensis]|uniref:hypothetical protein n=1 Tax=Paractinoplanes durhamensis TaxID=113563 RepID=UPI001945A557|nr:hypothetical protein [Actinoplanes durhamensis]